MSSVRKRLDPDPSEPATGRIEATPLWWMPNIAGVEVPPSLDPSSPGAPSSWREWIVVFDSRAFLAGTVPPRRARRGGCRPPRRRTRSARTRDGADGEGSDPPGSRRTPSPRVAPTSCSASGLRDGGSLAGHRAKGRR